MLFLSLLNSWGNRGLACNGHQGPNLQKAIIGHSWCQSSEKDIGQELWTSVLEAPPQWEFLQGHSPSIKPPSTHLLPMWHLRCKEMRLTLGICGSCPASKAAYIQEPKSLVKIHTQSFQAYISYKSHYGKPKVWSPHQVCNSLFIVLPAQL